MAHLPCRTVSWTRPSRHQAPRTLHAPERAPARSARLASTRAARAPQAHGNPAALPGAVLVCPGFLRDYRGEESTELSHNLARHLAKISAEAGVQAPWIEVLPITRRDWLPTLAGSSFVFYTDAMADAIRRLSAERGPVALVCLSAAGWIARLVLGGRPYEGRVYGLADQVQTLVTLGTPHYSLERYPFGRVPERRHGEDTGLPPDVQGSSLRLANALYPDAEALRPCRLVCVCGTGYGGTTATAGQRLAALARGGASWADTREEILAEASYKATCGRGDVTGDGVTPEESALLPGARHVLLPGVWHLPGRRKWYGSESVIPLWSAYLAPDPVPSRR